MRRVFIVAVLMLAANTAAEASWFHKKELPSPASVPGTAGRQSFAGIPGLGPPLRPNPAPRGTNPVVGSVSRTGIFAHPATGRTRYTGTTYNPTLGQFGTYRFKK